MIELEAFHMVLLSLVNVDCLLMHRSQCGSEVDFADDFRLSGIAARDVDDDEVVRRHRAQADGVGGIALLHPVPVVAAPMKEPCVGKSLAKIGQIHAAELFIR